MLTRNRQIVELSIRQQIDIEAKEINRQTRLVAFRAHTGDKQYVSMTS